MEVALLTARLEIETARAMSSLATVDAALKTTSLDATATEKSLKGIQGDLSKLNETVAAMRRLNNELENVRDTAVQAGAAEKQIGASPQKTAKTIADLEAVSKGNKKVRDTATEADLAEKKLGVNAGQLARALTELGGVIQKNQKVRDSAIAAALAERGIELPASTANMTVERLIKTALANKELRIAAKDAGLAQKDVSTAAGQTEKTVVDLKAVEKQNKEVRDAATQASAAQKTVASSTTDTAKTVMDLSSIVEKNKKVRDAALEAALAEKGIDLPAAQAAITVAELQAIVVENKNVRDSALEAAAAEGLIRVVPAGGMLPIGGGRQGELFRAQQYRREDTGQVVSRAVADAATDSRRAQALEQMAVAARGGAGFPGSGLFYDERNRLRNATGFARRPEAIPMGEATLARGYGQFGEHGAYALTGAGIPGSFDPSQQYGPYGRGGSEAEQIMRRQAQEIRVYQNEARNLAKQRGVNERLTGVMDEAGAIPLPNRNQVETDRLRQLYEEELKNPKGVENTRRLAILKSQMESVANTSDLSFHQAYREAQRLATDARLRGMMNEQGAIPLGANARSVFGEPGRVIGRGYGRPVETSGQDAAAQFLRSRGYSDQEISALARGASGDRGGGFINDRGGSFGGGDQGRNRRRGRNDVFGPNFLAGALPGGRRAGVGAVLSALGLATSVSPAVVPAAAGVGALASGSIVGLAGGIGTLMLAFHGLNAAALTTQKGFDALSPAQKEFATGLRELNAGFVKPLQALAQSQVLPGLAKGLKQALSPSTVGAVSTGVSAFSGAISGGFQEFAKMFGSASFGRQFTQMLVQDAGLLRSMFSIATNLLDVFVRVSNSAAPLVSWMMRGLVNMTRWLDVQTKLNQQNGKFAQFWQQAQEGIRGIGALLGSVVRLAYELGTAFGFDNALAVMKLFTSAFMLLGNLVKQNKQVFHDVFQGFVQAGGDALAVVKEISKAVGPLLAQIDSFAKIIGGWRVVIDAAAIFFISRMVAMKVATAGLTAEEIAAQRQAGALGGKLSGLAASRFIIPLVIASTVTGPLVQLWTKFFGGSATASIVGDTSGANQSPAPQGTAQNDLYQRAFAAAQSGNTKELNRLRQQALAQPSSLQYLDDKKLIWEAVRAAKQQHTEAVKADPNLLAPAIPHALQMRYNAASAGHGNLNKAILAIRAFYDKALQKPGLSDAAFTAIYAQEAGYPAPSATAKPPPLLQTGSGGALPPNLDNAITQAEGEGSPSQQIKAIRAGMAWLRKHAQDPNIRKNPTLQGTYFAQERTLRDQLKSIINLQQGGKPSNLDKVFSVPRQTEIANIETSFQTATGYGADPKTVRQAASTAVRELTTQLAYLNQQKEKGTYNDKQQLAIAKEIKKVQGDITRIRSASATATHQEFRAGLATRTTDVQTARSTFEQTIGSATSVGETRRAAGLFRQFAETQIKQLQKMKEGLKNQADDNAVQKLITSFRKQEAQVVKESIGKQLDTMSTNLSAARGAFSSAIAYASSIPEAQAAKSDFMKIAQEQIKGLVQLRQGVKDQTELNQIRRAIVATRKAELTVSRETVTKEAQTLATSVQTARSDFDTSISGDTTIGQTRKAQQVFMQFAQTEVKQLQSLKEGVKGQDERNTIQRLINSVKREELSVTKSAVSHDLDMIKTSVSTRRQDFESVISGGAGVGQIQRAGRGFNRFTETEIKILQKLKEQLNDVGEQNKVQRTITSLRKQEAVVAEKIVRAKIDDRRVYLSTALQNFRDRIGAGTSPEKIEAAAYALKAAAEKQIEYLKGLRDSVKLKTDENALQRQINTAKSDVLKANQAEAKAEKAAQKTATISEFHRLLGIGDHSGGASVQRVRNAERSALIAITKELAPKKLGDSIKGVAKDPLRAVPGAASMAIPDLVKNLQTKGVTFSKAALADFKTIEQVIKVAQSTGQKIDADSYSKIIAELTQIKENTNPRGTAAPSYALQSTKFLTEGVKGLTRAQIMTIRERAAQVEEHGFKTPLGPAAAGIPITSGHATASLHVNGVTINIHSATGDPHEIAKEVRSQLLKTASRNTGQTRGRNSGRNLGMH